MSLRIRLFLKKGVSITESFTKDHMAKVNEARKRF